MIYLNEKEAKLLASLVKEAVGSENELFIYPNGKKPDSPRLQKNKQRENASFPPFQFKVEKVTNAGILFYLSFKQPDYHTHDGKEVNLTIKFAIEHFGVIPYYFIDTVNLAGEYFTFNPMGLFSSQKEVSHLHYFVMLFSEMWLNFTERYYFNSNQESEKLTINDFNMARYLFAVFCRRLNIVPSWGMEKLEVIKDGVKFYVSGHHFEGYVSIQLSPLDLFDVTYESKNKEVVKMEDIYVDELVYKIDRQIEYIPDYKDEY